MLFYGCISLLQPYLHSSYVKAVYQLKMFMFGIWNVFKWVNPRLTFVSSLVSHSSE